MTPERKIAQEFAIQLIQKMMDEEVEDVLADMRREVPELVGECTVSAATNITGNSIKLLFSIELSDKAWNEMIPGILQDMAERRGSVS